MKAVQEAVAAKEYYHCDKTMVVTNSYFSRQAQTLAKANQVELWNRDTLVARLLSNTAAVVSPAAPARWLNEQPTVQPALPVSTALTCATCGKQVSARVHEYCESHPDIFHGLTYCYEHQKELRSVLAHTIKKEIVTN